MRLFQLLLMAVIMCGVASAHPEDPHYKADSITLAGGGKMFYETYGKGEPVILVHGHTLDRRMWNAQIEALKDHYWVITPDSRGYGLSADPVEGYQFTHADDIIALMDSLHIDKAHVVGLSMGGYVAGDFLAMYPERLLSSVMVSGEIAFNSPGPSTPKTAQEVAQEKKKRHALKLNETAYKKSRASSLVATGGSQRERMREDITAIVLDWGLWQVTHSTCRIYYGREAWARFRANPPQVPFLVIYGNKEKPSTYRSPLIKVAPHGKQVIVPDCGHMLNMERPEEFNAILLHWLQTLDV